MRLHQLAAVPAVLVLLAGCGFSEKLKEKQAERALNEGALLYQQGKPEASIAKLKHAISLNALKANKLANAWTIVGNAHKDLDQLDEALEAHETAIKADPTYAAAWTNRGIALRNLDRHDDAEKSYLKAIELEPDYAEAYASLGVVYLIDKREYDRAVETFEKAVKLDPKLAVAHANLAVGLAYVGRHDDADASAARAVKLGYKDEKTLRDVLARERESAAAAP